MGGERLWRPAKVDAAKIDKDFCFSAEVLGVLAIYLTTESQQVLHKIWLNSHRDVQRGLRISVVGGRIIPNRLIVPSLVKTPIFRYGLQLTVYRRSCRSRALFFLGGDRDSGEDVIVDTLSHRDATEHPPLWIEVGVLGSGPVRKVGADF